jgi:hypothetical protein
MSTKENLNNPQALLETLKVRFENNRTRHPDLVWEPIVIRLIEQPEALSSLQQMELTGGEPDVVDYDSDRDCYVFMDCSKESPIGRRSLCYDQPALLNRRHFPPKDSAMNVAQTMGIDLLDESDYRFLQKTGPYDTKTSSWIKTPHTIRNLNGALFCDFRYQSVFVYHNAADSYYESRGFRGKLIVSRQTK